MPVVGMSGLDGRSARRDAVGSGRKETRPKGGSVHKKKNKIQQTTATAPTTAVTFSLPAAPAPPPPLAEQQLLDGADTVAAESIVDAEEADAEEEAGWQAEQRLWRPLSRRRLSSSLWSDDTALGASQQRA
jgi:hypothetical protein